MVGYGMLIYFFVLLTVFVGAPILVITLVVSKAKRRNQNAVNQNYTAPVNVHTVQNTQPNNSTSNVANELAAYKNMLDQGLITEEEYSEKKKQILGI